jgi:hypothetical protein
MIEQLVQQALENKDEMVALDSLTSLHGVKERVGCAILAVFRPDTYTVMDVRAWNSLKAHGLMAGMDKYSWRAIWVPYLSTCRKLATQLEVNLRQLDRALYQANGRTHDSPPGE